MRAGINDSCGTVMSVCNETPLIYRLEVSLDLVWTPFLHSQKGLGSRLAGDTDKRFVYFVSSQNIRPSSFIPMEQN